MKWDSDLWDSEEEGDVPSEQTNHLLVYAQAIILTHVFPDST